MGRWSAGVVAGVTAARATVDLDSLPFTGLDGRQTTIGELGGSVRLIVNVASRCGFTPQYAGLERLWETYRDRGLTVIGFPTNQFLQELGSESAIAEFCQVNYGVTFPLSERVKVNGRGRHPLFDQLTKVPDSAGKAGRVLWNFEKWVVAPDGAAHRFRSRTEPEDPAVLALLEPLLGTA